MITWSEIILLRMKRQYFINPANKEEYDSLFIHMSPVPTTYWCQPGNPPTLPLHADFDDYDYNTRRRARRDILKGRFGGGSIAYVTKEDLELFGCLYKKELSEITAAQTELLELLKEEGPMNIGSMKDLTGLLVKDITPSLHKLQEAFIVYEDQVDNEGDRGWYLFESEFPEVNLDRFTKKEALKLVIPRFAGLMVFIDDGMLKSYFKLPLKLIKEAVSELLTENILKVTVVNGKKGYLLKEDDDLFSEGRQYQISLTPDKTKPENVRCIPSVMLIQRNDFLVRAYADELKAAYPSDWDALYYLLIDGLFHGVVTGRFKFGPHVIEDIILDLSEEEKEKRRDEIIQAVYEGFDHNCCPVKCYDGKKV